jgi:hypothetical protein
VEKLNEVLTDLDRYFSKDGLLRVLILVLRDGPMLTKKMIEFVSNDLCICKEMIAYFDF